MLTLSDQRRTNDIKAPNRTGGSERRDNEEGVDAPTIRPVGRCSMITRSVIRGGPELFVSQNLSGSSVDAVIPISFEAAWRIFHQSLSYCEEESKPGNP